MVKALLLCLLWASGAALAAPPSRPLTASLDRYASTLGEPLLLRVQGRDPTVLENLDLSPLAGDFEVFAVTRSDEGAGKSSRARLEATLYPLHAGSLLIPPLGAGSNASRPLRLAVQPDPDMTVQARISPAARYERQQAMLTVEIRDRADRQWSRPLLPDVPGLLLRPATESQREENDAAGRVTLWTFRWSLLTLHAGHYRLKLPMLDTYRLGMRLRLPLPVAPIDVAALPSYLPVTVPVGRPVVDTVMPPSGATGAARQVRVGRPFRWTLHVRGDGITPDALRQLLHLPQGERDGLRFYPATYALEQDRATGMSTLTVEVTVLPLHGGVARLPTLRLPYFDPLAQRIEQVDVAATPLTVRDPFWRRAALLAAAVLGLLAAGGALWLAWRVWRGRRARRDALDRVARAADAAELARAVCRFAPVPHPTTLRQWLMRAPERRPLASLVDELEQACFGAVPTRTLPVLKQAWLSALQGQRLI